MTTRYRNPPLLEAACEFQFRLAEPWDEAIRERFHDRIRAEYPNHGRSVRQDVESTPIADDQGVGQTINLSTTEITVYTAIDRRTFVQLAPDTLTVNVTTPYPSWSGVRPRIEEALQALTAVVRIEALTMARLVYIDRFVLPLGAAIDRYFTFRPHLAPPFPWQQADLYLGLHADESEGGAYTIELRRAREDSSEIDVYLMRSEYAIARDLSMDEGLAGIDRAHERINELFEACITDEMRAVFDAEGGA